MSDYAMSAKMVLRTRYYPDMILLQQIIINIKTFKEGLSGHWNPLAANDVGNYDSYVHTSTP
jgi:hypothetical protein